MNTHDATEDHTCGRCAHAMPSHTGENYGFCAFHGRMVNRNAIPDCKAWTPVTIPPACEASLAMRRITLAVLDRLPRKSDVLEPELQAEVERRLILQGYAYSDPARPLPRWIVAHWHGKHGTERQPQMPDLLIMRDWKHVLALELKTRNHWQAGQRERVEAGWWHVADSVEAALELHALWIVAVGEGVG